MTSNKPPGFDLPPHGMNGPTDEDDRAPISEEIYREVVRRVTELMNTAAMNGDEGERPQTSPADGHDAKRDITFDQSCAQPPVPASIAETHLPADLLTDLVLKWNYLNSQCPVATLTDLIRLPLPIVRELVELLESRQLIELGADQTGEGEAFSLTSQGQSRAVEAFSMSRYVGPAPVSLLDYTRQCQLQSPELCSYSRESVREGIKPLILSPALINELGTALCAGRSLILHGASGNGKTAIARRLGEIVRTVGGPIYVPYALALDREIVSVFDPAVHRPATEPCTAESGQQAERPQGPVDPRWRRCLRPFVLAPLALKPEHFELTPTSAPALMQVPLHVKANGGVLLLDDLGRQRQLQTITDGWLRILEEQRDHICWGGREIALPVVQLTVFATHLAAAECFDTTLLRRVKTKIHVPGPDEHQFREIFRNLCHQRGIHYNDWAVLKCLSQRYSPHRPPKASDPHHLLDSIGAMCRFEKESVRITEDLLAHAFQRNIAPNETSV